MRPIYMPRDRPHVCVYPSVFHHEKDLVLLLLLSLEMKNCPFVAYKNNGPKNLKSISNVLGKAN